MTRGERSRISKVCVTKTDKPRRRLNKFHDRRQSGPGERFASVILRSRVNPLFLKIHKAGNSTQKDQLKGYPTIGIARKCISKKIAPIALLPANRRRN